MIANARCQRLWRAALAWYARDCLTTLRRARRGRASPGAEEAEALADLETDGRQLAWLCENLGLDVEYTRARLVAWLAERIE